MAAREVLPQAGAHAARGERGQHLRRRRGRQFGHRPRRAGDLGAGRQRDDGHRPDGRRHGARAGIPVFTISPGKPDRGTLFDVGLDFVEVGRLAGELAADVLRGTDPATIPIRDVLDQVPRRIIVNTIALKGLRRPVAGPGRCSQRGDRPRRRDRRPRPAQREPGRGAAARPLAKKWNVDLHRIQHRVDVEDAEAGVLGGLARRAGRRPRLRREDPQRAGRHGDGERPDRCGGHGQADLLITFSTPTLQAAMQRAGLPIVFNYVAIPIWAGAGKSDTEHLPNVTGVYLPGAYEEMMPLIRKSCRTRACSAPSTSRRKSTWCRSATAPAGGAQGRTRAGPVAANSTTEVADAALSLASRKLDAICQLPGNLTASAFPSIAQRHGAQRLPLFAFQTSAAGPVLTWSWRATIATPAPPRRGSRCG